MFRNIGKDVPKSKLEGENSNLKAVKQMLECFFQSPEGQSDRVRDQRASFYEHLAAIEAAKARQPRLSSDNDNTFIKSLKGAACSMLPPYRSTHVQEDS